MRIDLQHLSKTDFKETEFFFCCWSPSIIKPQISEDHPFDFYHSDNFYIISSKSSHKNSSLISRQPHHCLLFRGYELDLALHSYSPDESKFKLINEKVVKNGVYTYLKFNKRTQSLKLKTDPFGISPLFMRKIGKKYFFASHPALISIESDEPDLISFLSLMQNGFIFGNRSYYQNISRVAAGTLLTITDSGYKEELWFDLADLPKGEEEVTSTSFLGVEKACQASISKCLQLKQQQVILPFSSGFDSRRFFASLQYRKVEFKTVTSQSYHHRNNHFYDIDAPCSSKIARRFGVDSTVISATNPEKLYRDLDKQNALIGSESFMHSWAVPLINWLEVESPSLIFDGLGGDTIGNGGFEFEGLHNSCLHDIEIIIKEMVNPSLFSHLNECWPSLAEYEEEFRKEMRNIPTSLNQVELIFLQFRSRRTISPWITMMQPPGHVVVFPYLDLNFVSACLAYNPKQKLATLFQKECLKRFWPQYYYNFKGTRDLPNELQPIKQSIEESILKSESDWLHNSKEVEKKLLSLLNNKNKFIRVLTRRFPVLFKQRSWLFDPIVKLLKFNDKRVSIIHIDE